MEKRTNHIFSTTGCLSSDTLERYLKHTLTPSDRHTVEKHLLECPFCSEALEGLFQLPEPVSIEKMVRLVDTQIDARTQKKNFKQLALPWSLAASLALLLAAGIIFFINKNNVHISSTTDSSEVISKETVAPKTASEEASASKGAPSPSPSSSSIASESKPIKQTPSETDIAIFDEAQPVNIPPTSGYTNPAGLEAKPESIEEKTVSASDEMLVFAETVASQGSFWEDYYLGKSQAAETFAQNTKADENVSDKKKSTARKQEKSLSTPTSEGIAQEQSAPGLSKPSLATAIQAYNAHDYFKSTELLGGVLEEKPLNTQALLYATLSAIQLGKLDQAALQAEKMIANSNPLAQESGKWVKAILLLKQENPSGAKKLLEELSDTNTLYKDEALKILKKI